MFPAAPPSPRPHTALARLLAARIRERGPITFAEYMAECLYHPQFGYYNSSASAQRLRDYYTSVDVHPIFGRLLARQLFEIWELLGRPQPFWAVECGAGEGWLARHILDFAARTLAEFYTAVKYMAVEASEIRRFAHVDRLEMHTRAARAVTAAELPPAVPCGCIFSNEFLDALPVHRVLCEHGELREFYVGLDGDNLTDLLGPLSDPGIAEYFSAQGVTLLEGQQAEAGLAAARWIRQAGRALRRGFVLTVDYGCPASELYDQRHLRGTLLAYRGHRAGEDFFAAPGEQDLTAHVNFTAVELWGRRAGLEPAGRVSQSRFLMALGRGNDFADLYDEGQTETERLRARLSLKNLIYPEGMGETFQVFIQSKGIPAPRLTGLLPL